MSTTVEASTAQPKLVEIGKSEAMPDESAALPIVRTEVVLVELAVLLISASDSAAVKNVHAQCHLKVTMHYVNLKA